RRNEITLWHPTRAAALREAGTSGEGHGNRIDVRRLEQIDDRASYACRIDDERRTGSETTEQITHPPNDVRVRRAQPRSPAVANVVELHRRCCGRSRRSARKDVRSSPKRRRGIRNVLSALDDRDRREIPRLPKIDADEEVTHRATPPANNGHT